MKFYGLMQASCPFSLVKEREPIENAQARGEGKEKEELSLSFPASR